MERQRLHRRIIAQSRRRVLKLVFSRVGVITLLFLVQLGFLFFLFYSFESFLPQIWGGSLFLTAFVTLYIINVRMSPNAKLTWLLLIMVLPIFGCLLFAYTRGNFGNRALKSRVEERSAQTKDAISQRNEVLASLEEKNKGIASLVRFVSKSGTYPIYENSEISYFSSGEEKFEAVLQELKKAAHFIFLEYFIIEEGKMWDAVLSVLEEKARSGVDVRVMYDGTCEFTTLGSNFCKKLKKKGISCKAFAPITPFVSTHYNYRDHRKILVVDNEVAFCGGVNFADEYINEKVKFGHWKDTAVKVSGDAVESFTLMFLQMWSLDEKSFDFAPYLVKRRESPRAEGYVMPYADCPIDDYKTGEYVYIDILNRATDYVHIMTPYLVLDTETESALKFAAERGVDVSIILPGIPDKKNVWALGKTHYKTLIKSGVRIYEYTPGFVHAKVFVSDSREAVVGTVNLDYRSLYHHFECAAYFTFSNAVEKVEQDFTETLSKCREVTLETIKKEKNWIKIKGFLLKTIAPLM